MDVQTWIYNKVIVSIGQVTTESVANGRLVSWDDARTFRWQSTEDIVLLMEHSCMKLIITMVPAPIFVCALT